jgi:hypothetical protein
MVSSFASQLFVLRTIFSENRFPLFGIMRLDLPASFAAVMAYFSRLFQYFASGGNTRYEWGRTGPIAVPPAHCRKKGPIRHDPFVPGHVFVT